MVVCAYTLEMTCCLSPNDTGLLEAMGVGHAALRRVYDIAAEHGAAAKLTGYVNTSTRNPRICMVTHNEGTSVDVLLTVRIRAGGGGCALLLLPLGPDRAAEVRISSALHALGYTTVGLQLGSGGVRAETS